MSKNYQKLLKSLGIIALGALLVAAILYFSGNKINARIALGVSVGVSGVALMMYSLRLCSSKIGGIPVGFVVSQKRQHCPSNIARVVTHLKLIFDPSTLFGVVPSR
jgi:hypothetical protein